MHHAMFAPRASTLLILAAIGSTAWAEEATYTLDEVVVTGAKPGLGSLTATRLIAQRVDALAPATSDSASLLRDVPGVSLYGAGGVSSLPVIRGLADDRVRSQVDGMDLIAACPNHMNPALSYIDPSNVDSVKVYAGVTPVSVGGDSIGGSIVVESAKPKFAQPGAGLLKEGEVGGFYRSNGNAWGANANVTLAGENLSVSYTGSTARSDNYDAAEAFKAGIYADPANAPYTGRNGHTLGLDEVGSTAYETGNQSLGVAWRRGEHLVDLKYSHQDIPFENFPNQRMDMTGNTSDQINLGYEGQYRWGLLKARVYHEETEHKMDFGDDKRYWYGAASGAAAAVGSVASPVIPCTPANVGTMACAAGMPMDTSGETNGLKVSGEIELSERDTLRVGGEYQAYRLDDWWTASGAMMQPNTFWNINNGERDRIGLFGEWEAKFSPQWTSLLGLRHEIVDMAAGTVHGYNNAAFPTVLPGGVDTGNQNRDAVAFNNADRSRTDRNWDLSALARYALDERQTYELGLAQKTRSPNLYERYTWSTWQMAALMNNFVGDGNGYVGDINLKPEVAHTLSLAADWHDAGKKAWGVRVAPYYTRVKDYIDAVQWNPVANTAAAAPTVGQFTVLKYANQSARLYGIDLSAFAQLARDTGYGDFALSGLVNYVDGKNRDTGDNLYNIMPLNGKLTLTHKLGRWSNSLEGLFVSGKNDTSAVRNEIETSGYSLFNLRGSYAWKQVRLDLGVENLFDRAYDLPLGGAYVGQGTTMTIGANGVVPQWGTAVPGPARSFYVGLNYTF